MASPKVSVVIPTYNRLAHLRKTLPTLLGQSCKDTEFLLCDDASTDGTENWVHTVRDPRLRYFRNSTNSGIYANYHRGMALCSGEYIAILHDHDLYHPDLLQQSCRILDAHPSVTFVHSGLLWIDAGRRVTGVDVREFPAVMQGRRFAGHMARMTTSPVMAATAVVRKSAYAAAGSYEPEKYGLGCDMMMWFRLAMLGDVGYLRTPMALIRARERNKGTAVFSWAETERHQAMLDEMRRLLPANGPVAYLLREVALRARCERAWAQLICRAHLIDRNTLPDGIAMCRKHHAMFPLLADATLRFVPGAARLSERYLLQRHYRRVECCFAKEARRASDFMERSLDVQRWVSNYAEMP